MTGETPLCVERKYFKICAGCTQTHSLSMFYKYRSLCRPCLAASRRTYMREYARSPKAQKRITKYRADNREKLLLEARLRPRPEYMGGLPIKEYKRQFARTPKEVEARKAYKRSDRGREVSCLSSQRRRATELNAVGNCTVDQMHARAAIFGFKCAYCGGQWEHNDHAIPLRPRSGEASGTNWPANMRPACSKCNAAKSNKPLKQWLSELNTK